MIGRIVRAGVGSRILVVITALAALAFGVAQVAGTPVEAVPEFAPVTVEVQSEALGLSAQEVEDLVTVPLESNLLSGVAWVDTMQSTSMAGLSSIVMTFEDGTDPIRARQVVQERLTQGALLTNASKAPVMLQPTSAANRVMMIGLSAQDQTLVDLSVLSRWTIRPKLMSVEGVANVAVWGMRDRQLHVRADPVRMQQRGVSLDELVATTGNSLWVSPLSFLEASTPGRGGFLDLPQQRVNVQHVSPITDSAALGRVAVEGASGPGVTLADVATIVEAPPTIIGDGIVAGSSGLVLVVEKQPGASTAAVSEGIEDALASLSVGLPGVTMDSSLYRPADYVGAAGRNLAVAGLLALGLVLVGSALLYRAWRPVVTVVSTVAVALVAGWLVLWVRDAPVTLLAVTGLGAGAVLAIAQAVAAVDGMAGSPPELTAARRVGVAYGAVGLNAVYTALAAVLLVVPVYLLEGRAGAFLPEAATGFLLATAGCLVVALVVGPGIAALVGAGPAKEAVPRAVSSRASAAASRLATSAVAVVAVIAVGAAAALALVLVPDAQTRPAFAEPTIVMTVTAEEGTSPQALTRTLGTVAGTLRDLEGVAGVGGHVGRAVTGERVVGANSGELWISLTEGADRDAVAASALEAARGAGGLEAVVGGYLDGRVDRILPDAAGPLVVSVYGPEPESLRASAASALEVVRQTPGVGNARLVEPPTEQTLQITVDLARTEALGMTPGEVRRQAATLVGGLEVGAIFEQQKVFDVQVWTGEDVRNSPEKVRALRIDTPDGGQVALGDVATVEETAQPSLIRRESVQRRLDIVADVSSGQTRDAVAANLARMTLPAEYHAEVRGESAGLEANERNVLLYGVAAAIGVLLLLQAATRNWWTAVAATAAIPLGMVGGLVLVQVVGLTVGALAGLLALAVLGVHHALTVVRVARARADDPGTTAAVAGAVLPATALTVLVGGGLAVLGGGAGLEVLWDLAVVVVGGALTSGLVAVVVLPAVAARYGGREEAVEDFAFDEAALYGHLGVGANA
ncbi:efflux RND transporter permease subunit [Oryzobacter sp. R7]|uniref:efflux RND transporter permease subunit n=1 Tax=Oryzobacter faecalis TaxID=3388656 RepID=UPI00398CB565